MHYFIFSAPSDYAATTVNRSFLPGGPTSINISVSTVQDTVVEGSEDFSGILTLTGDAPGIVLGSTSTAIATIGDDDGKFSTHNNNCPASYNIASYYCFGIIFKLL